jgi:hypothetical protein
MEWRQKAEHNWQIKLIRQIQKIRISKGIFPVLSHFAAAA